MPIESTQFTSASFAAQDELKYRLPEEKDFFRSLLSRARQRWRDKAVRMERAGQGAVRRRTVVALTAHAGKANFPGARSSKQY
jgi:hypothetical protein